MKICFAWPNSSENNAVVCQVPSGQSACEAPLEYSITYKMAETTRFACSQWLNQKFEIVEINTLKLKQKKTIL